MQQNMGVVDRTIRTLLAIAVAVLWYLDVIGGVLAIVLAVFAVVFLLTSFVGHCPAYVPFKISTRRQQPSD
jgi:hypothetical protein